MATQPPPWKRKTRPCPFYSQGRCLFADSCNFIHSVKIQNDSFTTASDTTSDGEDRRRSLTSHGRNGSKGSEKSGDSESSRASKVFRRSYRSPPRSPRLSGLLFALEPVIGPDIVEDDDIEEHEEEHEEVGGLGRDEEEELGAVEGDLPGRRVEFDQPVLEIHSSTVTLDDCDDSQRLPTPMDGSFNVTADRPGFSFLSDFPTPPSDLPAEVAVTSTPKPSPKLRLQIPSPIDTHFGIVESIEAQSNFSDGQLTASGSAGPQSTFDLLSSPFASPVKRTFSPRLFPSNMPFLPDEVSRSSDDLDSLTGSPSAQNEEQEGSSTRFESARTPRSSRLVQDEFSTARAKPRPLSTSSKSFNVTKLPFTSDDNDEDLTITAQTQYEGSFANNQANISGFSESMDVPSFEQFVEHHRRGSTLYVDAEDDDDSSTSSSPVSSLFHRTDSFEDRGTLSSVMDYYSDPSPISSNVHSSNASETLIDVDAHMKIDEEDKFSRRTSYATISAPQKVTVESRSPSPHISSSYLAANREPPNSAPPVPVASTSQTSWPDVTQRSSSSSKVPFGFRHSAALSNSGRNSALSQNHDASPEEQDRRSKLRLITKSPAFSHLDHVTQRSRSMSPSTAIPSSRRPSWMRPLHLSHVNSHSSSQPSSSSSHQSRFSNISTHSVTTMHANNVPHGQHEHSNSLSSARSSLLSSDIQNPVIPAHDISPLIMSANGLQLRTRDSVLQSLVNSNTNPRSEDRGALDLDLLSPLSGSMRGFDFDDLQSQSISTIPPIPPMRPASSLQVQAPPHAVATPRPTLLFAIASDDPAAVEQVLSSGDVRPNDDFGPQSALEFALTNEALTHRTEIVKTLLAYGADPSALPETIRNPDLLAQRRQSIIPDGRSSSTGHRRKDSMNPAVKYYLNRAKSPEAQQSTAAIRRSFFRPLTRIRFDFVGQDRALEHLYRVLSMHSQQPIASPLVVLCCGPSGHGKSHLARKFGSLLDVPTHTVNMTILKSAHDLWQCPSMSPYDEPSTRTLADFLSENEGKRCVVVLDEIDKNEDERNLWSLLAPWELGRCPVDAGRRHIDVRNVIWLGTSNIGQDLLFQYYDARDETSPDTTLTRDEYRELMALLRPRVSAHLGTSLMSRVTAVLPFVPFTSEEKLAIASEALLALGGEYAQELSADDFEQFAARCVDEYVPSEGARSLYRSVSTHLMEAI